jgi:hypothetical protein
MDSSDKNRDHLRWQHIEGAAPDVYYENQRAEVQPDCKAHADAWGIHSELRQDIFIRTRQARMERTGKRKFDFPYSKDHPCSLYFKFRKRNQEELAEHYRALNRKEDQMW